MNKRKKLIRDLADKTGTSRAAAANMLDRNKPEVCREPVRVEDLFERRRLSIGELQVVGKEPGETAYYVSEDGDFLMASQGPGNFLVPLVEYGIVVAGPEGLMVKDRSADQPIAERMGALLLAASREEARRTVMTVSGAVPEPFQLEEVRYDKVEAHFRRRFEGREGKLRIFQEMARYTPWTALWQGKFITPGNVAVAVLGYAGVWIQRDDWNHGLCVLSSRVAAVRVVA